MFVCWFVSLKQCVVTENSWLWTNPTTLIWYETRNFKPKKLPSAKAHPSVRWHPFGNVTQLNISSQVKMRPLEGNALEKRRCHKTSHNVFHEHQILKKRKTNQTLHWSQQKLATWELTKNRIYLCTKPGRGGQQGTPSCCLPSASVVWRRMTWTMTSGEFCSSNSENYDCCRGQKHAVKFSYFFVHALKFTLQTTFPLAEVFLWHKFYKVWIFKNRKPNCLLLLPEVPKEPCFGSTGVTGPVRWITIVSDTTTVRMLWWLLMHLEFWKYFPLFWSKNQQSQTEFRQTPPDRSQVTFGLRKNNSGPEIIFIKHFSMRLYIALKLLLSGFGGKNIFNNALCFRITVKNLGPENQPQNTHQKSKCTWNASLVS